MLAIFLISKQTLELTFVSILIAVKSVVTEWLVPASDAESRGQNWNTDWEFLCYVLGQDPFNLLSYCLL